MLKNHRVYPLIALLAIGACSQGSESDITRLRLGAVMGDTFAEGAVALDRTVLFADQSLQFTVRLVDQGLRPIVLNAKSSSDQQAKTSAQSKVDPRPISESLDVSEIVLVATSACADAGRAVITLPSNPATDGTVTGTYADRSCAIADRIVVTAVVLRNGARLTAGQDIPVVRFRGESLPEDQAQGADIDRPYLLSNDSTEISFARRSAGGAILDLPPSSDLERISFASPCLSAGAAAVNAPAFVPPSGGVVIQYSDLGCTVPEELSIILTAGDQSTTLSTPIRTVTIGSNTAGGFLPAVVSISNTSPSPLSTTSFSAQLSDFMGAPLTSAAGLVPGEIIVNVTSPCIVDGRATAQVSGPDSAGRITGSYTDQGCTSQDTLRVRVSRAGSAASLLASGTLQVQSAPASVLFDSAVPKTLRLRGFVQGQESAVSFRVLNRQGDPVPSARVDFALSSSVGGISLSDSFAVSDSQGRVTARVRPGSVPSNFTVTARTTLPGGEVVGSQSETLSVFSGVPSQAGMSAGAEDGTCLILEGFDRDGVTAPIAVRIADRFGNLFTPATRINAVAAAGAISGGCEVSGSDPEMAIADAASSCSFTFRTQGVRPSNGVAQLLFYLEGEETFDDQNGNGGFDEGEPFVDRGHAFLDVNGNGFRDEGEIFIDRQGTGSYSDGNGIFDGYRCSPEACTYNPTDIFVHLPVVLSGSTALFGPPQPTSGASAGTSPDTLIVQSNSRGRFAVEVMDGRGNQMPTGTVLRLSVISGNYVQSVAQLSTGAGGETFAITCPGRAGSGTTFDFQVETGALPEGLPSGARAVSTLLLVATTPQGVESIKEITIQSQPAP